jgi:hypothetical protein
MSNRYVDFSSYMHQNISPATKQLRHLQKPTNEKEEKRKNRIQDITENPKKIWANNAFVQKLKLMQDAQNYRNEIDRIRSIVNDNRIPANRRHLYRGRLHILEENMRHLRPIISEHGEYHHAT